VRGLYINYIVLKLMLTKEFVRQRSYCKYSSLGLFAKELQHRTLCLIMSVSPFVCLYTTTVLVIDLLKTYVGNFLYHVLLILIFVAIRQKYWTLFRGTWQNVSNEREGDNMFKNVEPIMNSEWASIETHH